MPDGKVGFAWQSYDFTLRNCIFTGDAGTIGLEDIFGARGVIEDCRLHTMVGAWRFTVDITGFFAPPS